MSDYAPDFHPKKTLFQVGVKAVVESVNTKKILILTRSEKVNCIGCADLPGGNLENFESPLEGISREILEETGLVCNNYRIVHAITINHRTQPLLLIGYHCQTISTEIALDWESSSYEWLTPKDALNLDLFGTHKDIIKSALTKSII